MANVNILEVKERNRSFITKANIDNAGEKIYKVIKTKGKTYSTPTDLAVELVNKVGKEGELWQSGTDRPDLVGEVTV